MCLVMDFGEILSGQPDSLQYLEKGKKVCEDIWKRYGMKLTISGIDEKVTPRQYYLKEELSGDQE